MTEIKIGMITKSGNYIEKIVMIQEDKNINGLKNKYFSKERNVKRDIKIVSFSNVNEYFETVREIIL